MAIKFFNIKTGETREATTEPMIAALWGSSDMGPNVQQGQDFGWRIAPETVVEVKEIKSNYTLIQEIAQRYRVLPEEVTDAIILKYIADRDARLAAAKAPDNQDLTEEYQAKIRELEAKKTPKTDTIETVTTTKKTEK